MIYVHILNFILLLLLDETLARKLQEDCKKEWPSSISNTNLVSNVC